MPEIITDEMRKVRESVARVAALRDEARQHRIEANTWYATYEKLIAPAPGAYPHPPTAISAEAQIAYQRAAHHTQARAAAAAEAAMEMMLAQMARRA